MVSLEAPQSLSHRLLALGVVPGARIRRVRSAALGDPVQFRIGSFYLALRSDDAQRVQVRITCADCPRDQDGKQDD